MLRLDDLLGRPPRVEGERPTRFHTQHRELIPLREWPSAARPLLAELSGRIPAEPWLPPAAVRWLRRALQPGWSVLELGAGRSTPWLASRVSELTSFESEEAWRDRVARRLEAEGLRNVELELVPLGELAERVRGLSDERYDLVVVDFREWGIASRIDCIEAARPKVRPGRYLLLDDSDRPRYRRADELLAGWATLRFAGMTHSPFAANETSVYRRRGEK
jgi:hypothetical protein